MPYKNIVYIIYPKGTAPEVVRMLEAAIKDAKATIREELKGKSFTRSDFTSRLKSIIAGRIAGLPIKARVAIIEKVDVGVPADRAADLLAIWNPAVEDFRLVELIDFEKVTDPEITIKPEIPIGEPWFTVGMYKTFGKTGSTILIGGGLGALTFILAAASGVDWKTALIASLILGGFAGAITYITMAGVEAGIPVAYRR